MYSFGYGAREYLDVLGTLGPGPDDSAARLLHRCVATDAPMSPLACAASRCARCSVSPRRLILRGGQLGRDRVAFTTSTGQDKSDVDLNPYFAAAYEAAHGPVYNCLVAARPAERRDGEMQEAFPIETVRRLAQARDAAPAD